MKFHNLALILGAAALLPTLAYAANESDAIRASFAGDLVPEFTATYLPPATAEPDQLDAINVALRNKPGQIQEPDQILASFERDLYRIPTAPEAVLAKAEADPLDVIYAVLRAEKSASLTQGSLGALEKTGMRRHNYSALHQSF